MYMQAACWVLEGLYWVVHLGNRFGFYLSLSVVLLGVALACLAGSLPSYLVTVPNRRAN